MARGPRKARPLKPTRGGRPLVWLLRHAQVAVSSLGRLSRAPLSTLMTAAVIGIALALPTGLDVLLNNLQQLAGGWTGAVSISLFLHEEVSDPQAERLAEALRARPEILSVEVLDRDQALEEFRRSSGLGAALDALEENPLPAVLVLKPREVFAAPEAAERLLAELDALPETDIAQLDLQWVQRFHAITEIARRGVLVLGGLLALAVLLIVGNTIRLEIQNRHAEIEITKLIGATDAFIRRPFLYCGLWYGLLGGLIAWLMVSVSLWAIKGPVERLAGLYQSGFDLSAVSLETLAGLLAGSALLGLLGSWVSVGRHLHLIEPA